MKLLSPQEVAAETGLPYSKALALIKELNHIQINNRYYIADSVLYTFLQPETAIRIVLEE